MLSVRSAVDPDSWIPKLSRVALYARSGVLGVGSEIEIDPLIEKVSPPDVSAQSLPHASLKESGIPSWSESTGSAGVMAGQSVPSRMCVPPRLVRSFARLIAGKLPPGETRLNRARKGDVLMVVIAVISDEMLDATDAATSVCTA